MSEGTRAKIPKAVKQRRNRAISALVDFEIFNELILGSCARLDILCLCLLPSTSSPFNSSLVPSQTYFMHNILEVSMYLSYDPPSATAFRSQAVSASHSVTVSPVLYCVARRGETWPSITTFRKCLSSCVAPSPGSMVIFESDSACCPARCSLEPPHHRRW